MSLGGETRTTNPAGTGELGGAFVDFAGDVELDVHVGGAPVFAGEFETADLIAAQEFDGGFGSTSDAGGYLLRA